MPFTAALGDARVGLVEAGPGYGRTTLLGDIVAAWRHGVSRWAAGSTPADLRDRLRGKAPPHLLMVDDADRLPPAERAAVADLAAGLPRSHRMILVTRGACADVRRLADELCGPRLSATDLLLGADDLARGVHGMVADAAAAGAALLAASGGWAEGARLALRAGIGVGEVAPDGAAHGAVLVSRRAHALPARRLAALRRGLSLPRMRDPLLRLLAGGDDVLGAALAARVPLARAEDGGWSLPAPLGDLLRPEPLQAAQVAAVAEWCLARDLAAEAFAVLWAGERHDAALQLLERLSGADAEALLARWTGPLELPSWRLRHTPLAAERLAWAAERAGHPQRESRRRLAAVADTREALPGLRQRAELARDLLQRGHADEARGEAATLLRDAVAPDVRAGALEVIARVARRAGSVEELALASTLLREALALWRRADEPGRVAETRLLLAAVDRDRGHSGLALERVAIVRRGAPPGGALWVQATLAEAALLCDTGRCQAAGALLEELERVAWAWAGPRVRSRAAVVRAWAAVHREDFGEAARWADQITANALGWMDGVCGLRNLAAAADVWSRLGRRDRVAWCLRLIDTVQVAPDWEVTLARASAECRVGDPVAVMAMLRPLEPPGAAPARDRWRVLLLSAFAALEAGAQDAPARAAGALQAAVAAGDPYAPFVRERDLARRVLSAAGPVAGGAQ